VPHRVHLVKGENGERQLTCHFLLFITAIKTNMLLIIFLGLIVKFASVCDGCDVGNSAMNNFDWNQVAIFVLTRVLKEADVRTAACVYIPFVLPLTVSRYNYQN